MTDASVTGLGKRQGVSSHRRPSGRRSYTAIDSVDYVILFADPTFGTSSPPSNPTSTQGNGLHRGDTSPSATRHVLRRKRYAIVGDPKDHSTRDIIKTIKNLREK
jgi:hypothetical protein